ncbi:MAG: hypothetical protein QXU60_04580 [Sulfolobales archaeon]
MRVREVTTLRILLRVIMIVFILAYILPINLYLTSEHSDLQNLALVRAETSTEETSMSNLYYARLASLDLDVYKVLSMDNRVLVLAGRSSSGDVIRVVRFSSDFSGYSFRDYIIHGRATYISSSDSSGRFIVVGTELGEIDVIDLNLDQITYIQASRYPISKVFIGRIGGEYYIVAYDGLFIYAYKYASPRWLEIGPIESSALAGFYPASVVDISPLIRVSSSLISYDVSRIFMIYTPPKIRLIINITDQNGNPIDNAIITLTYTGNRDIYYKAISVNGSVELDVPILDPNGSIYELRVTHPMYQTFLDSIILTRPRYPDEVRSIRIVMLSGAGVSELFERVPPRSFISLISIDLSRSPYNITKLSTLIIPSNIKRVFFYEVMESIYPYRFLSLMFSEDGVYISYYDSNLRIIRVDSEDYVRYYTPISDLSTVNSMVSSDGSMILVSLDSRLYLFSYDPALGRHVASSSYVFSSLITDISLSSDNILSVSTEDGRSHLFRISNNLLIPCLRSGGYSGYPVDSTLLYTYISRDSSYNVFVGSRTAMVLDARRIMLRCPIDRFTISIIPEIQSAEKRYIEISGVLRFFEGGVEIARASVNGSVGVVYLPYSTYSIILESAQVGREVYNGVDFNRSSEKIFLLAPVIPIDLFIRVRVDNSTFTLPPISVSGSGLSVEIINTGFNYSMKLPLTSNPLPIYMAKGVYTVNLFYGDHVIALGSIIVDSPGILYGDLIAKTYVARVNVVNGLDGSQIDPDAINMSIIFNGPFWSGMRFAITPGRYYILPAGFYRINIDSIFYMPVSADIELFANLDRSLSIIPTTFDTKLILRDVYGRNVGKAFIYLKNMRTGAEYNAMTDDLGEAIIHDVTYDRYAITVSPLEAQYFNTTYGEITINSTYILFTVEPVKKNLNINLVDPVSGRIIAPLNVVVYIDGIEMFRGVVNTSNLSIRIPTGSLRVVIRPTDASLNIYQSQEFTMNFTNDSSITLRIDRLLYRFRFEVVDMFGDPVEGFITISSIEREDMKFSGVLSRGVYEITLPYGFFIVLINATNYVNTTIRIDPSNLVNDTNIYRVSLESILIPIGIQLVDQLGVPIKGSLNVMIYVGGRAYTTFIVNRSVFEVSVPKGYDVSLRIDPSDENKDLYQSVGKNLGRVDSPLNTSIELYRRLYTLTFRVVNDLNQPENAFIELVNLENPAFSYKVSTIDGIASVRIVAGSYEVSVDSNGYIPSKTALSVNEDGERLIVLSPTIFTLLSRFTLLYIGIGVIIAIIIIGMWLRRVILKRLEEEVI